MQSRSEPHPICFGLHVAVLNDRDAGTKGIANATCPLLHHVCQFVSEQLLALRGAGVVLARSEIQIRTVREGQRTDGGRLRSYVDADIREAGFEERFHFLKYGLRQRLTTPAAKVREIGRQLKRLAISHPLHDRSLGTSPTRLYRVRLHRVCAHQIRLSASRRGGYGWPCDLSLDAATTCRWDGSLLGHVRRRRRMSISHGRDDAWRHFRLTDWCGNRSPGRSLRARCRSAWPDRHRDLEMSSREKALNHGCRISAEGGSRGGHGNSSGKTTKRRKDKKQQGVSEQLCRTSVIPSAV